MTMPSAAVRTKYFSGDMAGTPGGNEWATCLGQAGEALREVRGRAMRQPAADGTAVTEADKAIRSSVSSAPGSTRRTPERASVQGGRGHTGVEVRNASWRLGKQSRGGLAHAEAAGRWLGDYRRGGRQPAPGAGAGRTPGTAEPSPAAGTARSMVMAGAPTDRGRPVRPAAQPARMVRAAVAGGGDRLRTCGGPVHADAAFPVGRPLLHRADSRSTHRSGAVGHRGRPTPRRSGRRQRAANAGVAQRDRLD